MSDKLKAIFEVGLSNISSAPTCILLLALTVISVDAATESAVIENKVLPVTSLFWIVNSSIAVFVDFDICIKSVISFSTMLKKFV